MKNLSDFQYNPKNPRIIRDKPFKDLKKSLQKSPWMMKLKPIVVDETGMILAGDKRHRILVELKYKEVPDEWILKADDLTEEQKNEFIIKDNLHAGEWDWGIINQEWDAVQLKEWNLQVPEWDLSLDAQNSGGDGDDEEKGSRGTRIARVSPGDGFAIFEMILQADQKQAWDKVLATLQNRLALEKQSDAFMVVLDTFLQHHPIGGDSANWAVDVDAMLEAATRSERTAAEEQPPLTVTEETDEPDDDDLEDLDEEDDDDDQDEDQEEGDQPEKPEQEAKKTARKSHKVVPAATKKRGRPAKAKATA